MKKNKFILSTYELDSKSAALFRSYCHLLQPQLNSRWIVNNSDKKCDVLVVNGGADALTNVSVKAKIILEKSNGNVFESHEKIDETRIFKLYNPIKSVGIINILNKVSSLEKPGYQQNQAPKKRFILRETLSKLATKGLRNGNYYKKAAKSISITNKLLDVCQPNRIKQSKIVFLGRPGVGKTTAIGVASTDNMLTTEVNTTDSVGLLKKQTTIGIDYGELKIESKIKLRLYGTPGQDRYDFIRNQTVKNTDIYIIMVSLASFSFIKDLSYFENLIEKSGNRHAIKVIALTHSDLALNNNCQLVETIMQKKSQQVLVSFMDPRKKSDVQTVLKKAVVLMKDKSVINQASVDKNKDYSGVGLAV